MPDQTLIASGENHEDVHSVDQLWNLSLTAVYGATDNVSIGASLPYVRRTSIREPEHIHGDTDEIADLGDSEGFGDLRLFGQYHLFGDSRHGAHTAVILGIKTPTGEDDEKISRNAESELSHDDGEEREHSAFETEHQPGSGSWDPFIGAAHSWVLQGLALQASLLYTLATEGTQDTDLGDSLRYNLAAAYRLFGNAHLHSRDHNSHPHTHAGSIVWDALLEIDGEWREKQEIAGEEHNNSGGSVVCLAPGGRIVVNNR